MKSIGLIVGCFMIATTSTVAQLSTRLDSSIQVAPETRQSLHSNYKIPGRALLYSAFIPGGGQIYNRSWIKLGVLYGGYSFFLNSIVSNRKQYLCHRDALIDRLEDGILAEPYLCRGTSYSFQRFTTTGLRTSRDNFRRSMELGIIGISILHMMSMVDAFVEAHLDSFDVSDDLGAIRIQILEDPLPYNPMNARLGLVWTID